MMEISLYLCAGQNVLLQLGRVHLAVLTAGNSGAFSILCCPCSLETPGNARAGVWVPVCWRDS